MKRITAFLSNLSREAVPNSIETFDGQLGHFEYPSQVIRTPPNEDKISHRWRERVRQLPDNGHQSKARQYAGPPSDGLAVASQRLAAQPG